MHASGVAQLSFAQPTYEITACDFILAGSHLLLSFATSSKTLPAAPAALAASPAQFSLVLTRLSCSAEWKPALVVAPMVKLILYRPAG